MDTIIGSGAFSPLALLPSALVVDGRGRMSTGGYATTGTGVFLHQEKSAFALGNAQTTDLRGIPPRGSAPV